MVIDRTLDEQLAEMTALIFRLPEVQSLLQRAGLNPNTPMQEPKAALTLFIKVRTHTHTHIITFIVLITVSFLFFLRSIFECVCVQCVGRVYCGLQQQAERVSMVCKALDYIGDIMKFIKPNLLNKSTEGLHITYWTLGGAQYALHTPHCNTHLYFRIKVKQS